MSNTTKNLNLFKYDIIQDANQNFSVEQALNANWNKIDENCIMSEVTFKNYQTTSTISSTSNTTLYAWQENIFETYYTRKEVPVYGDLIYDSYRGLVNNGHGNAYVSKTYPSNNMIGITIPPDSEEDYAVKIRARGSDIINNLTEHWNITLVPPTFTKRGTMVKTFNISRSVDYNNCITFDQYMNMLPEIHINNGVLYEDLDETIQISESEITVRSFYIINITNPCAILIISERTITDRTDILAQIVIQDDEGDWHKEEQTIIQDSSASQGISSPYFIYYMDPNNYNGYIGQVFNLSGVTYIAWFFFLKHENKKYKELRFIMCDSIDIAVDTIVYNNSTELRTSYLIDELGQCLTVGSLNLSYTSPLEDIYSDDPGYDSTEAFSYIESIESTHAPNLKPLAFYTWPRGPQNITITYNTTADLDKVILEYPNTTKVRIPTFSYENNSLIIDQTI